MAPRRASPRAPGHLTALLEGLDDAEIDEGLDRWCSGFAETYVELLARADISRWEARLGTREALERLNESGIRLALLTGNPEPVARARMERLGLARGGDGRGR